MNKLILASLLSFVACDRDPSAAPPGSPVVRGGEREATFDPRQEFAGFLDLLEADAGSSDGGCAKDEGKGPGEHCFENQGR